MDNVYLARAIEEWRDHLNMAIVQSNFDLSDPNVVELSSKVDVLVLDEMRTAGLIN